MPIRDLTDDVRRAEARLFAGEKPENVLRDFAVAVVGDGGCAEEGCQVPATRCLRHAVWELVCQKGYDTVLQLLVDLIRQSR